MYISNPFPWDNPGIDRARYISSSVILDYRSRNTPLSLRPVTDIICLSSM